jgi:hypothetical protein
LGRAEQPLALGTKAIDVRDRANTQAPRTNLPRKPREVAQRAAISSRNGLIRFVISSELCAVLCRQTK